MRKKQILAGFALAVFALFNSGIMVFAQTPTSTPTPTQSSNKASNQSDKTAPKNNKGLVKVTVHKDGSMTDQEGNPIAAEKFAFTTYDAAGKHQMKKGAARSRPAVMYLNGQIKETELSKLTSKQKATIAEYLKAEKRVERKTQSSKRRATASRTRRQSSRPARNTTVVALSKNQISDIAEKIANQATSKLDEKIKTIVAAAEKQINDTATAAQTKIAQSSNTATTDSTSEQTTDIPRKNLWNLLLGILLGGVIGALLVLLYGLPSRLWNWVWPDQTKTDPEIVASSTKTSSANFLDLSSDEPAKAKPRVKRSRKSLSDDETAFAPAD